MSCPRNPARTRPALRPARTAPPIFLAPSRPGGRPPRSLAGQLRAIALALTVQALGAGTPLALPITQANYRQWLHPIAQRDGSDVVAATLARPLTAAGQVLPFGSQLLGRRAADGTVSFEWLLLPSGSTLAIAPLTLRPELEAPGPEVWIQLASFPTREEAEVFADHLAELLQEEPVIQEAGHPFHSERQVFRVRLGPFGSQALANQRLKELTPILQRHKIHPLIVRMPKHPPAGL